MPSTPTPASFVSKFISSLYLAERIFLTAIAIGTILSILSIDSNILKVSLIGLAVTYFLYAYKPLDIEPNENEKFGFSELIGLTILPKVLWISSAVSTIGVLFSQLGNEGYKQVVTIGGISIGSALLVFAILSVTGAKHMKAVTPVLLRSFPLLLLDGYIFFK